MGGAERGWHTKRKKGTEKEREDGPRETHDYRNYNLLVRGTNTSKKKEEKSLTRSSLPLTDVPRLIIVCTASRSPIAQALRSSASDIFVIAYEGCNTSAEERRAGDGQISH